MNEPKTISAQPADEAATNCTGSAQLPDFCLVVLPDDESDREWRPLPHTGSAEFPD